MPKPSKAWDNNTNVRASSSKKVTSKARIRKSKVDRNSEFFRYTITNTNITEVTISKRNTGNEKLQTGKVDLLDIFGKLDANCMGQRIRRVNPYETDNITIRDPRRYSYNTANVATKSHLASNLKGAYQHLTFDMHVNQDKGAVFMEAPGIPSIATTFSPVFSQNSSIKGGDGAIVNKAGYGVRSRAAALNIWGQRSKVPAYIVNNFDKARFRLQTDALNMATLQLKMPKKDIWKCLMAELLGTCLLIIIGCGCILTMDEPKALSLTGAGLCWGFTVATLAQTLGHVSGCHINPAVTLAMVVTGKIQLIKAGLYIIVQCIGAMMGAAVLKALTPDDIKGNWGITTLAPGVTPLQGFGIEFITTFILVLIIFGATDENRSDLKGSAPMAIGLAISGLIFFAGPFTGASFNPARSLGPSVVANHWNNHWVYWIGPIGGAVTAATLYHNVLRALSLEEIEALQAEEDAKQRSTETKDSSLPAV